MDVERALLADIAVNAGDSTPWLVLSDWLEEQGDQGRAELVRLSLWLRRHDIPDAAAHEERLRQLVASGLIVPLPRRRLELTRAIHLELVLIPPGTFAMGSPTDEARRDSDEGPLHSVQLSRPFWMGIHPITQDQWRSLLGGRAPGRFRGGRRPVDGVSYSDAQLFLRALNQRTGVLARLPTEAEWEYACRAGTSTPFAFGSTLSSHQANFDGNYPYGSTAATPWLEQTTPVGSYPPNAWGLHDMHGNVWEWCQDWFDDGYYAMSPAVDPPGPESGTLRVLRGGSWYSYSWSCRSAGRERFAPESGAGNYGFRIVVDVV